MSFKNGHFIMDCQSKQYKWKIIALSALKNVEKHPPPLKHGHSMKVVGLTIRKPCIKGSKEVT